MISLAPTVYLIDDDERVLRALRRLLTTVGHLVSCHTTAEDFLIRHDMSIPGCAVVDLNLPGMDGLSLQKAIAVATWSRPLIFLTGRGDIPASVRAMKAGAIDFLTKPVDAPILLRAVAEAIERDRQSTEDNARRRLIAQRIALLTPREREVLDHVAAGRINKQIAAALGTVEKTIKVHRGRMMSKMEVRTVADLIRILTDR